jgi:hypothetical protein
VKKRAVRAIAIAVMTIAVGGLTFVDNSWAQVGTVGGPGGVGSGSAGTGGGGGDGAGTAASVGLPGDTRVAGIDEGSVFVASTSAVTFSRRPAAVAAPGLTLAQERTWDAFHECATRGAMIDQLRYDGSFTFEATNRSDVLTIQSCMTRIGYRFDR